MRWWYCVVLKALLRIHDDLSPAKVKFGQLSNQLSLKEYELQSMKSRAVLSRSVLSDFLWPHGLYVDQQAPLSMGILQTRILEWVAVSSSRRSSQPRDQTQGFTLCRQILYHLSYQGSPRILEWVAYPSSRGSSQPRNWTGVSCIAGRFFTSWATREALWSRILC